MKNKSVIAKGLATLAMFGLILMVCAPVVAGAATATTGACDDLGSKGLTGVVGCIIGVLNNIVLLLVAGAVVFTAYGAFQMVQSEEKREEGKSRIIHGIIGLFVIVSIWGLVAILDSTFNLSGVAMPTFPAITP